MADNIRNIEEKKPLKVALIVGKMKGGGLEATILSYVCHIDKRIINYTIIVDEDSTLIPYDEFLSHSAKIVIVPPYQKQLSYQKALYKLFCKEQFDIVHAHINTLSVFPLFAAWRAAIPIRIVHNHNTAGKGEWKRNILKYMLRPFAKTFATHLCACSDYAGRWMFGQNANYTVMPNAIDYEAEKYLFNLEARTKKRMEFSLENRFVIGHVGRFVSQKNHGFLLDIFLELYKINPNARLLLIGTGQGLEEIKEKAKRLELEKEVIFAGQRSDTDQLYSAMDLLIQPSLYEGKPLVPMEAQYSGLPVVVSDVITKEIVLSDKLVKFVSLNKAASDWAQIAMAFIEGVPPREEFQIKLKGKNLTVKELPPKLLSEWYVELARKEVKQKQ